MNLPSMTLSEEKLSNFEYAIRREWIVTNGLGGYASSTVLGVNTRKYHGLLVAAFNPPRDRRVCLAKLDEDVYVGDDIYRLGANEFEGGFFPEGYVLLKEFSVSPFPKYTYRTENFEVEKTLLMPHERNAVIAVYRVSNRSGSGVRIRVFPLINWRRFHSVTERQRIPWEFVPNKENRKVSMGLGAPRSTLMMTTTRGHYFSTGKWVENMYYREESGRGESCLDDCYQHGYFEVDLKPEEDGAFAITAIADGNRDSTRRTLEEMPTTMRGIEALYRQEVKRYEDLLKRFYGINGKATAEDWLKWIVLTTNMFAVKGISPPGKFVIAGYHWFEPWGRDSFISLPGLMLVTRRFEEAREVFLTFKNYCKQGLVPNLVPDEGGEPAYNAVDATLWYVNAILQYLKYTGDFRFLKEQLWATLKTMVEGYSKRTAFNIHVDLDGLLCHGPQLTWMDAAVDGQPVTPRAGKAVEVQALWYNMLKVMELLASRFKERNQAEKYGQMAEKAKRSFIEQFWNPEKEFLFDTVSEHDKDGSLRPNQIIAVASDFTMLDNVKNERIVDIIHRELLTPFGLRTLQRDDPRYMKAYTGDRRDRDRAYHNGTVWPWLLGPFTTAFLKAKGYSKHRRDYAFTNFLKPLLTEQIFESGLGALNEIFDGESPYTPRGCIAQAWSVAEPLRAYVEDVMQIRPKHEKKVSQGSS